MLPLLMLISGVFEAVFGLSALAAPSQVIGGLGFEGDAAAVFLARILGAATLALGIAALIARNALGARGGLPTAYGLTLYNLLAGILIVWTAAAESLTGVALWGAGLFHAAVGVLLVLALLRHR